MLSGVHHTNSLASKYDSRAPDANPPKYESLSSASGLVMRADK
jgi:hypothetical protein